VRGIQPQASLAGTLCWPATNVSITMWTRSAHRARAEAVAGGHNIVDVDQLPAPHDVPEEAGHVMFTYDRGPGGPVAVTRADWMSLADDVDTRDGVVDAMARYVWQEELPPTDSADCLVFCSVWYKLLREGGPIRVSSMTQSEDIFSFSTWVFFFCEAGHWWIAVLSGVQRLERALGVTAAGGATHTGKPAAVLAFFNSMRGLPAYSQARSAIVGWLHFEWMRRGLAGDDVGRLAPGWVASCLAVSTPTVPQQRNPHDCGLYALSFFRSFFSCCPEDRSLLLRSGVVGKRAWHVAFKLQTRADLRDVCAALMERERGARGVVLDQNKKANRTRHTMGAGAVSRPPSVTRGILIPSSGRGPQPRHASVAEPSLGADVVDVGTLVVAHPGVPAPMGSSKSGDIPNAPSVAASAHPTVATAKAGTDVDGAHATDLLLQGFAKERSQAAAEEMIPVPPLELDTPTSGVIGVPPSSSDAHKPSPAANLLLPACRLPPGTVLRQRSHERKRARLSEADVHYVTWMADFRRWGLPMEPAVAATLCTVFSKTDGLTPAFVNLFASGVAKWHPPASQRRLAPWFAAAVLEASSQCGMFGGPGASLMLLSQVHTVLRAAYRFHGCPMPHDRSI